MGVAIVFTDLIHPGRRIAALQKQTKKVNVVFGDIDRGPGKRFPGKMEERDDSLYEIQGRKRWSVYNAQKQLTILKGDQ